MKMHNCQNTISEWRSIGLIFLCIPVGLLIATFLSSLNWVSVLIDAALFIWISGCVWLGHIWWFGECKKVEN